PVDGWTSLQEKIRSHGGQPLEMQVQRGGQLVSLRIVPILHEESNPIETVKHGRIGISAVPRAAEITVTKAGSPLHTFDKVVALDGQPVANYEELAKKLDGATGTRRFSVLRPEPVPAPGGTLWSEKPLEVEAAAPFGIEASDLTLFAVQPGGA